MMRRFALRRGYTLIELLITITLTMVMMFAVTQLFGTVSQGVANARSTLEMNEALRGAIARLRIDLEGATAVTSAPERPDAARGYLEFREGPLGPVTSLFAAAVNADDGNNPDTTMADNDDVLMFTVRSRTQPFVGRCQASPGGVLQSELAEVVYFVRGRTLYRRVLLIAPAAFVPGAYPPAGFYANNDVSVRLQNGALVPNSLGDLAQRENRFAHPTDATYTFQNSTVMIPFPGDVRRWLQLGLPTLQETAHAGWRAGGMAPTLAAPSQPSEARVPPAVAQIDYWNTPHPWPLTDADSGMLLAFQNTVRGSEDVLLNNVIGFDIKVWDPQAPIFVDANGRPVAPGDPGYTNLLTTLPLSSAAAFGAYVDLGYGVAAGKPQASAFSGPGNNASQLSGNAAGFVYDTWSTSYAGSLGANGLDDNNDGVVDDPGEWELPPPYPAKLRGIQIKVRVFEPSSRQVREVTLVQEFVAK